MKNADGSDITLEQLVALIQHEIKHHEERKRRQQQKENDTENSDLIQELTKLVEQVDYRAEINRVRVSRVYEEVTALKSKVRILEGKALDTEQDLALNKLGQMRASTRQEAIDRALNEGYNDGFRDGFKESEKYRSDVPEKLRKGRSDAEIILSESERGVARWRRHQSDDPSH